MDWSALAAAAATTAGNMASGLFGLKKGAELQRENMRYGLAEQRKHLSLLAQIMPSLELKGYQNAGINPMLENGLQSPSDGSLAGSPVPADVGHLGSDAVQAYQSFRMNESTIELQDSEKRKNYVESDLGRENIKYVMAQTDCTKQQAVNLAVEVHEIEERTTYYKKLQDKLVSEAALNHQNINLSKANEQLALANKKSVDAYIDRTLPLQWKTMEQDIDVKKTQADLNRINFADVSQKVTLNEMTIMQASEALADNIKAAGKEAQLRLGRAALGLKDVEILKEIKEDPKFYNLRVACALIGQMSQDTRTDIISNISNILTGVTKAAGSLGGAAIAAGAL